MYRFPLGVVGLAILAAPLAHAQSPLVYTPDSLAAPSSEVTVTNPTAATLQIQTFAVRPGPGHDGAPAGWRFEATAGGQTRSVQFIVYPFGSSPESAGIALPIAPSESGTIRVFYDPCFGCRPVGVSRVDTLVVVTDAGTDRLRLNTAGIVASEGVPQVEASALSVSPNPARDRSIVTLRAPQSAGEAMVEVFSVTGRRMAVAPAGPAPSGHRTVRLDVGGWPPGVYLVRASLDGQTVAAPLTVMR